MKTIMYNLIGNKSIDEIAARILLRTAMDFTYSSTVGPVPMEDRYKLVIDHFKERYNNGKDQTGKKYHKGIVDGITKRIGLIGDLMTEKQKTNPDSWPREARELARTLDAFFSKCRMPRG